MRFPNLERFHQYCVSKRRTYLRQYFERRNPRAFFELWKNQHDFAAGGFEIAGAAADQVGRHSQQLHWLLMQDLLQVVRALVPDFPPAPPSVIDALPGALHQIRSARSMLIAGEDGVGKEQLAILLHVLSGRPGALVRVAAGELGGEGSAPTRQMMPERGSVFMDHLEEIADAAQAELLAFLNGDARRRDLLFFVATCAEPRSLVSRHGVHRDLFVRVSQTEVRLPPLRDRQDDSRRFVADVVYDLVRIPAARLPELRSEARALGEHWRAQLGASFPGGYDLFAEALSYVMWREKKELVAPPLVRDICDRLTAESWLGNHRELCRRVAVAHDHRLQLSSEERPAPAVALAPLLERPRPLGVARSRPPARLSVLESPVPTQLSRDDLLRCYYQALLDEERGDLRRVAERAGRRLRSLHAELARLGIRLGGYAPYTPPHGEA